MIYSLGRGLNASPGFDDPTYANISRTTDMNSVHKMKPENIKDFFQILPLFGICTTLSALLKRRQESQSVRYFCHMTAQSLIGYWVKRGTIPINPN